jgi:ribosome-binding factor A
MISRRVARLSQAVREVVSTAILLQLRDPRIKKVTVLRVEVAADVRTAKVYVSIMGTEKERALCLHGLNASRGFLQSKIADRIETRYTPVLKFVLDDAVSSTAEEAVRILQELEDERRQRDGESVASADEESDDVNESEALLDSDVLIHETEDEDE